MALKNTVIPVEWLQVAAYTIPTDFPASDGTLEWDSTTLVLVKAAAGGKTGIGFTYADTATARLVQDRLAALVVGRDAMAVTESWNAMVAAIRNLGRPGICSMAIAAVDTAALGSQSKTLGAAARDPA